MTAILNLQLIVAKKKIANGLIFSQDAHMNQFVSAIKAAIKTHGYTQAQLAEACATSAANFTKLLQGRRPGDELLVALCSPATWPDHETGLNILRAWLDDEVVRAGRTPDEIGVSIMGDNPTSREIDTDLRDIRDWLPGNPDLLGILRFLAETAREVRDTALNQPFTPPATLKPKGNKSRDERPTKDRKQA